MMNSVSPYAFVPAPSRRQAPIPPQADGMTHPQTHRAGWRDYRGRDALASPCPAAMREQEPSAEATTILRLA